MKNVSVFSTLLFAPCECRSAVSKTALKSLTTLQVVLLCHTKHSRKHIANVLQTYLATHFSAIWDFMKQHNNGVNYTPVV